MSLVWYASGELPVAAAVERAAGEAGTWRRLGTATASGNRVTYVDHDAPVGHLRYRLAYMDQGTPRVTPAIEIEIVDLSLAVPGSGSGGARVSFTLPEAGPTRLELLDLAGRQWRDLDLGVLPAGRYSRDLASAAPAGVYFVRLSHSGRSVTARMVLIE